MIFNVGILFCSELKVPDAFQKLIDSVESTIRHAIVEEENIPFETVTNFDEVRL